jgi:hypothetical protein
MFADQWSLHLLGVPVSVVLAAFAGAFLSLSWQRRIPAPAKCAAVWLGTLAGAYLTPLAIQYAGLGTQFQLALAFGIGLVGEPALHRLYQRMPQIVDKRTGTGDEK